MQLRQDGNHTPRQRQIMNKRILQIALPAIATNITVPLLGMVDVAIVGHLGNAVYIGAIAVGSMIFNLIYWVFGFLRMGTSGMTAQAKGGRRLGEVTDLMVRSLKIALLIALLIFVFQGVLKDIALRLIHPPADVVPLASLYFNTVVWGAPAVMALYAVSGWFIGMENTRIPMVVSLLQNVVNIVCSVLLVYGFGMKVEGVALGTVIAQYAGTLAALALWWRYYRRLWKYRGTSSEEERTFTFRDFFAVNSDIFLRSLFLVAVNLVVLAKGAVQGTQILAVNTLLMQFYILFSYFMDGFAYAGEAIGGKYWGAGNAPSFDRLVCRLFGWGVGMAAVFTAAYFLGGTFMLHLLTDDRSVIGASTPFFFWVLLLPLAGMAAFVWDGIFIGVTATKGMLFATCLSAAIFFTILHFLFGTMGNHALWMAFDAFLLARGLCQTIWFVVIRSRWMPA